MLLYLSEHSSPDISFDVHQCAQYAFSPTFCHKKALICIGQYLKGTKDQGLILTRSDDLKLDCYSDADFAQLWNHKMPDDRNCLHSRTGYVITLSNFPIVWVSKMQTAITLLTM